MRDSIQEPVTFECVGTCDGKKIYLCSGCADFVLAFQREDHACVFGLQQYITFVATLDQPSPRYDESTRLRRVFAS